MPEEELGDDLMMEAARLEERRDEIIETTEAEAVYSEADRKRAGVIVTIGDEGEIPDPSGPRSNAPRPLSLPIPANMATANRTATMPMTRPTVPARRPRRCPASAAAR